MITTFSKHFLASAQKKNTHYAFKDFAQFNAIIDVLVRKNQHHLVLATDISPLLYTALLAALVETLAEESTPHFLRGSEIIYLDEKAFAQQKTALETLLALLNNNDKVIVLACSAALFNRYQALHALAFHAQCRLILFKETGDAMTDVANFATIHLAKPPEADIHLFLQQERTALQAFHQVIIPDELLLHAYQLAERYFGAENALQHALLLLDSAAARSLTHTTANNQVAEPAFKSPLTLQTLLQVCANATQIPYTHLSINKFKLQECLQHLQQRIFGQDMALDLISRALQQAHAKLRQNTGPFCTFLFAGSEHAGKKSTAAALTEHLFKQLDLLYLLRVTSHTTTLNEIKLQRRTDKNYYSLAEVLTRTPYAILMFENIEEAPASLRAEFQEILTRGFLSNELGAKYCFQQSILIFSTQEGALQLTQLAEKAWSAAAPQNLDLMQLIMFADKQEKQWHELTAEDLVQEIKPIVNTILPDALQQHCHIVPFLPLNQAAVEKILRLKLTLLGKMLHAHHEVELSYAPEVIRYLTTEVTSYEKQHAEIDKVLQQLYFVVEQAVLNQAEPRNRPAQLFLQLNETGQLLRCEWLTTELLRQHA